MDRYKIEIEPCTRVGWLLRDAKCLRVTLYDTGEYGQFRWVGTERTRRRDQGEAHRLAARMISEWESNASRLSL